MNNQKNRQIKSSFKSLFLFSFRLISKKAFVICSIIAYALVICLYTSIIPVMSDKAPITLFRSSYSTSLLMLLVSSVISVIAVEIFRTPIDDGTELLIVSKPISRKEIVFTKLLIFLIYVVSVSIVGTIITAFTFINRSSSRQDSTTLVLGVLLGTVVNGLLFGSITTILSIYFKKIVSMVISVGVSFALLIVTFLGSFTIKSPVQILQDRGYTITPITVLDSSKDNKTNTEKLLKTNALFSTGLPQGETLPKAWNSASSASPYKTFSFFDFGYQLSSLYTLSYSSPSVSSVIGEMSFSSTPVELIFDESYKLASNPLLTKVHITAEDIKPGTGTTPSKPSTKIDLIPINVGSYDLIPQISNSTSIQFDKEWKNVYKYNVPDDFIQSKSTDELIKIWNDAWNKYGKADTSSDAQYVSNYEVSTDKETLDFLNNYFKQPGHSLNNSDIVAVLRELCLIQLGVLLKLSQVKNLTVKDTETNKEYTTILRLGGSKIERKKPEEVSKIIRQKEETNEQIKIEDFLSLRGYTTKFKWNGNTYKISLLGGYGNSVYYKNFVKTSTKSLLNKNYTIPLWISVSVVVFASASALYFKRDFA